MQRGKIIHYNQNEGKGIINANGSTHEFHIGLWRGNEAPKLNGVVEIDIIDTALSGVLPVSETQLAQEKAAEIKSQMGAIGGQLGQHTGKMGAGLIALHGIPTLVAFAVFMLAGLALTFANFHIYRHESTLCGMGNILDSLGKNQTLTLLIFWGSLSALLAPLFSRQKAVWLLLCLPLLAVLLGAWDVYRVYGAVKDAAQAQSALFGGMGEFGKSLAGMVEAQVSNVTFSKVASFGAGFYVMVIAALWLTWQGVLRFLGINR